MSWYDSNYKYRIPVAVDNTASAGTTQDVTFTIPPDLAEFWTVIQSTGYDLRVTTSDGITLVTYQRASWTYASRIGTIELDNVTTSASKMTTFFLYWGYSAAADAAGSFVAASAKTGYLDGSAPVGFIIAVQPEPKGRTKPTVGIQKMANETTRVFFDFNPVLLRRRFPYQGSRLFEEIKDVVLSESQSGGVQVAAMTDVTAARFRDGIVEVLVKAGTTGTTYTVVCRVTTTRGSNYNDRVLEGRCLLTVKDVSEA